MRSGCTSAPARSSEMVLLPQTPECWAGHRPRPLGPPCGTTLSLLFIFNPMIYMADSTADTSVHSRVRSIKVNLFIVFSFFSLHCGRQSLFLSFPLRQIRSTHASSLTLSFFSQILNISYDIVYIVRLVTTRFQFCWNCFGTFSVR